MDVEQQLTGIFLWKALLELASDGAVARANIAVYDLSQDRVHVSDLCEFEGAPVVKESRALEQDRPAHARLARVLAVVEGAVVEPETV